MHFITLRLLFIMVCFSCLIGLGLHFASIIDALPHTTRKCLENPNDCDGIELGLSVYVVESIASPTQFTLGRSGLELLVTGDSKDLSVGQRVSVKGKFIAEPVHLVADTIQVHRYRAVKEFYGILCLIIVSLWVIREWSVSGEGLNRA